MIKSVREPKDLSRKITKRDIDIFEYLWKWKVISTHALANKFFPESKVFTAYRRLQRLKVSGYLDSIIIKEPKNQVWSLGPKGYKCIRPFMTSVRQEGHKSENPRHDYLASAFQIGEWLLRQPEGTQTISEQQLRRIAVEFWPAWVPRSELHRPDGYSTFFQGEKQIIIAYETELNFKTKFRYEPVVTFYDSEPSINAVFWLIESRTMLNSIRQVFNEHHSTEWSKHHFVLLADFEKHGWSAPFVEGKHKGKCINNFLALAPPTLPPRSSHISGSQLLLDIQKRPITPPISEISKNQKNPN